MTDADMQFMQTHCPPEVVDYVRMQDMTRSASPFWPPGTGNIFQYSGPCHLAVLGYVVDKIDASTSWGGVNSALHEMRLLHDHLPEALKARTVHALQRIAQRPDALQFPRIYEVAQRFGTDLRPDLYQHQPQPGDLDPAAINSVTGMARYVLYLASFDDDRALDAYAQALALRAAPLEIRKGLEGLHDAQTPRRARVLMTYIDDPRQEQDVWGGRGDVLGQVAREMLDMPDYTGPRRLLDHDGRDAQPLTRPWGGGDTELRTGRYRLQGAPRQPLRAGQQVLRWD